MTNNYIFILKSLILKLLFCEFVFIQKGYVTKKIISSFLSTAMAVTIIPSHIYEVI